MGETEGGTGLRTPCSPLWLGAGWAGAQGLPTSTPRPTDPTAGGLRGRRAGRGGSEGSPRGGCARAPRPADRSLVGAPPALTCAL